MYEYKAIITRCVDGDTFDATVDLGFGTYKKDRFRLRAVDAPEIRGVEDRTPGLDAKAYLESLVLGKEVIIKTYKGYKYGRWLAHVSLVDGTRVETLLVENGHAVPW